MESAEHQNLLQWMDEKLFHFSCKTINSNAMPGGVRLGAEQALNLPYVSVRTLMSEDKHIGLDYLVNAGKDATHFKRVRQLLGEIEGLSSDQQDEKNLINQAYLKLGTQHAEHGLHTVSPRLRQLLIPSGGSCPEVGSEANYVAMTPLASAGLSEHVSSVSKLRQDLKKTQHDSKIGFDRRANRLSVGGSNPQNVGGRVRSMSSPLVFVKVPKLEPELRAAFSVYYQGFRPRLPFDMVRRYAAWQVSAREKNTTMELKAQESSLLSAMLDAVHRQAQKAERLLSAYADILLEPRHDALLEAHLSRGKTHADRRAQWLLDALSAFRLSEHADGTPVRLIFSPEDRRRVHQLVKEI